MGCLPKTPVARAHRHCQPASGPSLGVHPAALGSGQAGAAVRVERGRACVIGEDSEGDTQGRGTCCARHKHFFGLFEMDAGSTCSNQRFMGPKLRGHSILVDKDDAAVSGCG